MSFEIIGCIVHSLIFRRGNVGCSEGLQVVSNETDSVIQLLARLGNRSLVQQVEKIDRQFGLLLNPSNAILASGVVAKDVPASQINQISGGNGVTAVQVFVSSTFQDMYGERDLISGLIFPALRKNLSRLDYPVLLNEIDLRWGVPEAFSKTGECLRMCLEKVITSDYLVVLIGERFDYFSFLLVSLSFVFWVK